MLPEFLLRRAIEFFTALKDNDGMTAAAWAERNKRDELARLLREAEKKR